jgi:hypothetical protein
MAQSALEVKWTLILLSPSLDSGATTFLMRPCAVLSVHLEPFQEALVAPSSSLASRLKLAWATTSAVKSTPTAPGQIKTQIRTTSALQMLKMLADAPLAQTVSIVSMECASSAQTHRGQPSLSSFFSPSLQ